jgi:quinol monooxygenase YgiN
MTPMQKSSVQVLATFSCKAGKVDELVKNLKILVPKVQAEAGCIKYDCYRDLADPLRFTFIEEWASAEDLAVHAAGENLVWWNKVADELRVPGTDIRKLTAI